MTLWPQDVLLGLPFVRVSRLACPRMFSTNAQHPVPERRVCDRRMGRYPVLAGIVDGRLVENPGSRPVLAGFSTFKEEATASIDSTERTISGIYEPYRADEAQLAAAAFLARHSGRPWTPTIATCATCSSGPPIMTWRSWNPPEPISSCTEAGWRSEGLAASTIDRRLPTACGFYRLAHIDGRISSNPAQYVRRPTVHPTERPGLDRSELGRFLFTAGRFDHAHALRAAGAERASGQRSLRRRRRGHGLRPGTPGPAHHR